jgi:hypothetical protein
MKKFEKKVEMSSKDIRKESAAYAAGNWFMMPRVFLKIMKPEQAVLLSVLIDMEQMFLNREDPWLPASLQKEERWFWCSAKGIRESLGWGDDAQKRVMRWLKDEHAIQVAYKGQPAKRYVRINWEGLTPVLNEIAISETGGISSV